jgi:riboflavin kinase/FMN adenylyltransferase
MPHIICISLQTMQPAPVPQSTVLCLGNFDGVHVAHRALMHQAKELRAHRFPDAACGVFCFDPPSSDYFTDTPAHLCTREQRLERFREMGMEYAFLADFEELRRHSPEQYVTEVLCGQCHCVGAVCGFNHRFGYRGAGNPALLEDLLEAVEVQPEYTADGKTVSSSRIRALLLDGKAEEASALLCHPYTLRAKVLHGKQLGRTWGFPTVNQRFEDHALIPHHGVYVTECTLPDGRRVRGISNVGSHPTVDRDAEINCETHLLDFEGDLYGMEISTAFLHFIRPEQCFSSAAALKEQIARDTAVAKNYTK